MRMLAIDCATEACSLALFEGGALRASRHVMLGRGHAEQLVPLIAGLPDKGRADEIRVSLGPGSFTGVRIGLAAARALGLAWGARVRGYPTLALVAAGALAQRAAPVTVCMAGGHGEWFVQDFEPDGMPAGEAVSLMPAAAQLRAVMPILAGNRARALAGKDGPLDQVFDDQVFDLLPDARLAFILPEALLTDSLAPIYGRAPDARLPATAQP